MKLRPFEMERWQSEYEHVTSFNLSESGVEPVRLGDLLGEEDFGTLLKTPLGYAETRGSEALREAIASLYPDCEPENVLVTTGTAEANLIAALGTMERGSRVVTVLPNYMQVWGLAKSLGCKVDPLRLREERGWQPSQEDTKAKLRTGTDVVSLSNPNNPTGTCLTEESTKAITDGAEDARAWILSDEVYRGAELEGSLTPTLWGTHDRVLVTSGLSKAFGLAGLRLGWICGPRDTIRELWAIHDYTTIALSKISEVVGTRALVHWRDRLLTRTRDILRRNLPVLRGFVERCGLAWVPPAAGAIAFLRYPWKLPSLSVAERALKRDVLVVPGSHFQEEGYLRVGYGMEAEILEGGLRELRAVFGEVGVREG